MPDDAVVEMLEGLVAAHAHLRRLDGFPQVRRGSQSVRDLRVQRVERYKADAAYGNYEYFVTSKILPPSKTLLLLQAVILVISTGCSSVTQTFSAVVCDPRQPLSYCR